MKRPRFTEEFRQEAVKQVIDRGYTVNDVAKRLGVSAQGLYKWVNRSNILPMLGRKIEKGQ